MSRSYKKHAYIPVGDKSWKKIYNRKLRRTNKYNYDIPNNIGLYKRENNSWNIVDLYCGFYDEAEYKTFCDEWNEKPNDWYKYRSK